MYLVNDRSKIFLTIQGITFIGLAAGPWVCLRPSFILFFLIREQFTSLIVPPTSSTDIYFYISMSLMTFTSAYMILLCPESRASSLPAEASFQVDDKSSKVSTLSLTRHLTLKFLSALVSPIVMFAPRPLLGNPQKKSYSLTLVGLALFLYHVSYVN